MKHLVKAGVLAVAVLLSSAGYAETDSIAEWDVKRLRERVRAEKLSFDVADSWVTEYLRKGGSRADITGLKMPLDWKKNANFKDLPVKTSLPESFDWREETGGLQPIRNQGSCGSCWAFATTAVLESLLIIKGKWLDPNLAEQTLVSNCERGGSCSGGYFSAFNYMKSPGLPDEAQDPYVARNTSCKRSLEPKARITSWSYIKNGQSGEPTIAQLKSAIMTYGPIAVGVSGSFGAYSSGVYNRCRNAQIDHMVNLEGWDDSTQSWIMRNSWGKSWGENGYMRIKYTDGRGKKCNNIGTVAAFAEISE